MNSLLKVALSQYGVEEIRGQVDNPVIVNYFNEIGHSWVKDDETAWCSAFMNWCALKSGYEMSKKLNARSWMNVGEEVETPTLGDAVVFWRERKNSWKGHIAIFIREDENNIYVLGGNQGNKVQISPYPKERLLSYRRLKQV